MICTREAGATPGLTLRGVSTAQPPENLMISFIGVSETADALTPATLEAASVVALAAQCYRIESPPRQWLIHARGLHLHRDARAVFFQAVPPRPAPLGKRLFWRAVLWLAGRPGAVRLLRALRGR